MRRAALRIALLAALVVATGCSNLALPADQMTAPDSPPAYVSLAANYMMRTLKDRASYDAFEISNVRWVDSLEGWTWLACVRFRDRGHMRTYVLFIKGNAVVDGRYAVQIDACDAQTYTQFDLASGVIGQPTTVQLEPLH
jgi:hypothetical protein